MAQRVVILGSGVASLNAAHELIQRRFDVETCEALSVPGSKARSVLFQVAVRSDLGFRSSRSSTFPVPVLRQLNRGVIIPSPSTGSPMATPVPSISALCICEGGSRWLN